MLDLPADAASRRLEPNPCGVWRFLAPGGRRCAPGARKRRTPQLVSAAALPRKEPPHSLHLTGPLPALPGLGRGAPPSAPYAGTPPALAVGVVQQRSAFRPRS